MKERAGEIFSIGSDNVPVPGCTISKNVYNEGADYILYFSLAAHTDISAEIFEYPKWIQVVAGQLEIYTGDGRSWNLTVGESYVIRNAVPYGMRTETGAVYVEIGLGKETEMNQVINAGEVFALKDLVPYQEDKIVNMDIINEEKLKLVVMSFAEGTGLAEHAAPGEALIFALDGNGIIGYEGKEYPITAGQNFKFEAGGKHYVKADGPFKMALLLTLK